MDLGFGGKVVIVTGGASGIGKATVESFAEEGASVIISDINPYAAQKLAEKVVKNGGKALAVKTDVTKKSDVDNLLSDTLREFDRIDILANIAGVGPKYLGLKFVDLEEEEWDRVMDINVKGIYFVTKAVIPHMIASGYGKIINMSSIGGKEGYAGWSHYAASKFAVMGITQSLAKELAEYNINVNAVCPGTVRTPLWEVAIDNTSERTGLSREQIFDSYCLPTLLKRPLTPKDMANVILFLSSEVSSNITGEAISINGGVRMD